MSSAGGETFTFTESDELLARLAPRHRCLDEPLQDGTVPRGMRQAPGPAPSPEARQRRSPRDRS